MFLFIAVMVGLIWGVIYLTDHYTETMILVYEILLGISFAGFAWWINYKEIKDEESRSLKLHKENNLSDEEDTKGHVSFRDFN